MIFNTFDKNRAFLDKQYDFPEWNKASGLEPEELYKKSAELVSKMKNVPHPIVKARLFEFLLLNAQIYVCPQEVFAEQLNHDKIIQKIRNDWYDELAADVLKEEYIEATITNEMGAFTSYRDFSHTCPDWQDIAELGYTGLIKRVRKYRDQKRADSTITEEQEIFYESCEIVLLASIKFMNRLADEAERLSNGDDNLSFMAKNLRAISERAPENTYEALQLALIHHALQDENESARLRTMGGLDRLYERFYKADIAKGIFTNEQIKELYKYFMNKFHAAKIPFDEPIMLGGYDVNKKDVTSDLSYLILKAYDEINVHNPKVHIRYNEQTPEDFLLYALDCIRRGKSSILFISDEAAIKSLLRVGVSELEARDYVPIGCYEPAVMGHEVPCTGSCSVNMVKALEFVFTNGADMLTGKEYGLRTGLDFPTFEDFYNAVFSQLKFLVDRAIYIANRNEEYYLCMNPAPLFSSTIIECVENGRDAYDGGAKYNNSSVTFGCLASLCDAIVAVKKIVYDNKLITFPELSKLMREDWRDSEKLRLQMLNDTDKYGNNKDLPDKIAEELCEFSAEIVNMCKNSRGGVYKAGMFSIDKCHYYGLKCGATPDGRKALSPFSKNLSSVTAMDREGVTALISTVTKLDMSRFPNGSVLDIMLHPSAVSGDDGLKSFFGLFKTYFQKGGFAIQGNVFDVNTLREAQKYPEKYATLQVRVCGWNVYFVNLSKPEQDEFIKQAEHL